MNYPYPISELEERIGHTFKDKSLIMLALTHSSFANEMKLKGVECDCNERLEFLGDSVLSLLTTRHLFSLTPELPEGEMSKVRAAAVCEGSLFGFAKEIKLGCYMRLGHGEELNKGRNRPSILADAFEALLAALYLDGGIDVVDNFLMPMMIEEVAKIIATGSQQDYKTALQQVIQQDKDELLEYRIISEDGPAHKRTFEVEALLNGNVIGHGKGNSKRAAEQNAAKEALGLFGIE